MYRNLLVKGRLTVAFATASMAALTLAGCGGGGGGSSTPVNTNSPYAGNYTGTFTTSNSQSGTLTGTIGTNGSLTGSGQNNTIGQSETFSGSVANSGATSVSFVYPSFSATATGTIAFASNGHLDGTLTQSGGGSVTIDLVKQ